jgi:hypothetical protein
LTCATGYRLLVSGNCCSDQLNTNCADCNISNVNNCTLCIDGYYLNNQTCKLCNSIFGNLCISCSIDGSNCTACVSGYYVNSTNNTCVSCNSTLDKNCTTCAQNGAYCLTCITGYTVVYPDND